MTLKDAEKMQSVAISNMTEASLLVHDFNVGRKALVIDMLTHGVADDDIILDYESFNIAHTIVEDMMSADNRIDAEAIIKRYVLALLMLARHEI